MTDNETDDSTAEVSAEVRTTSTAGAEISAVYSTEKIREFLEKGEIAISLILVSVRVEHALGKRIKQKQDLSESEFDEEYGRDTLGDLLVECEEFNLIEEEEDEPFDTLRVKRNALVHDRGFLEELEMNEQMQDEVRELIERIFELVSDEF